MALGVGDIVRTTVNFLLPNGVQYQNVYQHIFDGIGGVSDAAVVLDIKAWAQDMYATIQDWILIGTLEQLSSVDQIEWSVDEWVVVANLGVFTIAFNPAGAGQQFPNQISPFVTFRTNRPKTVGRKFLFPFIEGAADAGILTAPAIADLVDFADDAVNDINIDVANDLHPGVTRVAVNDWETFQVAVVTDLVGTQRRRRPGYGA